MTEESSRPATLDDLKTLIRALNENGVDYLLIGGYALFAHGYHRATIDVDILVPANPEAGAKVKKALMVLPDQAAKHIDPAWFEEDENIRVKVCCEPSRPCVTKTLPIARYWSAPSRRCAQNVNNAKRNRATGTF